VRAFGIVHLDHVAVCAGYWENRSVSDYDALCSKSDLTLWLGVGGITIGVQNCYGALTGHDYDRMRGPTDA
jgi:hypothetical protein